MPAHKKFKDRSRQTSARMPSAIAPAIRALIYLVDARDPETLALLKTKGIEVPPIEN